MQCLCERVHIAGRFLHPVQDIEGLIAAALDTRREELKVVSPLATVENRIFRRESSPQLADIIRAEGVQDLSDEIGILILFGYRPLSYRKDRGSFEGAGRSKPVYDLIEVGLADLVLPVLQEVVETGEDFGRILGLFRGVVQDS